MPSFADSRLCLVVIIALPAVTPNTLKNSARFALWDFSNGTRIFFLGLEVSQGALKLLVGQMDSLSSWASLRLVGQLERLIAACISVKKHRTLRLPSHGR